MSVLVDKNTRLVVQGITGKSGAFHTRNCMEYGTNVVAGVTPARGGEMFDEKVPVFDTVHEARKETGCNATMIFVPPEFAADAILEAAGLGFLGLGAQPPTPEWGAMLADTRDLMLSHPWVMALPGLAILTTVLAINLMGDGLRDALDPRLRRS